MSGGRPRLGCPGLLGVAAALLIAWLAFEVLTAPNVARLAQEDPATTAFITRWQKRERRAGRTGEVEWRWVPATAISRQLKRAAVVSEDGNFYRHQGFDMTEVRNALRDAWEEKSLPRGASTITQQLAKNLWLSPSRNPVRKIKEIVLTRRLERHLTKARILEIYLNVVEFGPGVYGAEAAARHYFGKSAAGLTLNEAAQLVAGLPKPSKWHPGSKSRTYLRRVQRLERRIVRSER